MCMYVYIHVFIIICNYYTASLENFDMLYTFLVQSKMQIGVGPNVKRI